MGLGLSKHADGKISHNQYSDLIKMSIYFTENFHFFTAEKNIA